METKVTGKLPVQPVTICHSGFEIGHLVEAEWEFRVLNTLAQPVTFLFQGWSLDPKIDFSTLDTTCKTFPLERAAKDACGGNSRFTAGAVRYSYNGIDDVRNIMPDLSNDEIANTDFGIYSEDEFFDDMFRITQYRTDADLCERLVRNSFETVQWLHGRGIRFVPSYGRQAFKVNDQFRFWGGLCTEYWGGGPGIIEEETRIAKDSGIRIEYGTRVVSLMSDGHQVSGVRVKRGGEIFQVATNSVVIATGGFEANHEWRTRYLGPGWDLAKVRGTRHNVGDGIRMALEIGAQPYGNWSCLLYTSPSPRD